eukprot:scaffold813_cov148-Amphora_coffeaeformis.AAC.6
MSNLFLKKGCFWPKPSEASIGGRVLNVTRFVSTKEGPEVTKDRWEQADVDPSSRPHRVLRREDVIKKALTEEVGDAGPENAKEIPPTESDENYPERSRAKHYGPRKKKSDQLQDEQKGPFAQKNDAFEGRPIGFPKR